VAVLSGVNSIVLLDGGQALITSLSGVVSVRHPLRARAA
jgi:hypothetical protein